MSRITRNIVIHLDFDIEIINKHYILRNKIEDDKKIYIDKVSLVQRNINQDFIWPTSLTVTVNDNYVYNIYGITSKDRELGFGIDCMRQKWKLDFDNYDSNTDIHLIGRVEEPLGRNVNY